MASEPTIGEVVRRIEKIEQKDIDQDDQLTKLRIDTAVIKVKIALYAAGGASVPTGIGLAVMWQMVRGA